MRVSSTQQSVLLSLGRYHLLVYYQFLRGYHPPSSQCYYHWVDIICQCTISSMRVSSAQQSVLLSLGRYHLLVYYQFLRGYHPPSSQCYYHWVDITASVLLVHEGIIAEQSVTITGSIPLLVYYQSTRVSSTQQSVLLSLGRYHRASVLLVPSGYHPPSSQCYYHWVDTICQCTISSTRVSSTQQSVLLSLGRYHLLVYYQSTRVSSTQQSVLLSLGRYHLLVYYQFHEGIIRPVVSVTITGSIPSASVLLVPTRVSSTQQSVLLSLGRYHLLVYYQFLRGYHPPSSQCYYHWVDIICQCTISSMRVSSAQQLVLLSLGRYHLLVYYQFLRGYHPPSSQCFYHQVGTSSGGLLVPKCIIHPVVSVSITRSVHLLVDYQFLSV